MGKCNPPKPEPVVEDKKPSTINVFTTMDTVPPETLQKLETSEELKQMLRNPHLRNFLQAVDTAQSPWNAMKLAMMEPLFLEFADECLKIVDPPNAT